MKKIYTLIALFIPLFCVAQPGIITTVDSVYGMWSAEHGGAAYGNDGIITDAKGNVYIFTCCDIHKWSPNGVTAIIAGLGTDTSDGIPAISAQIQAMGPGSHKMDSRGNFYLADYFTNKIRKIDTSGIITTIGGTGGLGYSGDGGPATSAQLNRPKAIAVDRYGNVYFAEEFGKRVRKIDTSGIITTIAGNGSDIASGDGGPALAAGFNFLFDIAVDAVGNVFVLDSGVRRITPDGMVYRVTGAAYSLGWALSPGIRAHTGDGGPADTAYTEGVWDIDVDAGGNLYMASRANGIIRKVNTAGVITTIAGIPNDSLWDCPVSNYDGFANALRLCTPFALSTHPSGDLYFTQHHTNRLRKLSYPESSLSDSFSYHLEKTCSGGQWYFRVDHEMSSYRVRTYYGDGYVDTLSLILSVGHASGVKMHDYTLPGTYTIKHVLYNGTLAVDSVSYSYIYAMCNMVSIYRYIDRNGNGVFDTSTEEGCGLPAKICIDSNGVSIDTISITCGLHYTAFGAPGDIYSFRFLSVSDSIHVSSPSSGVVYDTIAAVVDNSHLHLVGLSCTTLPSHNFLIRSFGGATVNRQAMFLTACNAKCTPTDGTLTFTFSPKYNFDSASVAPTSIIGNRATWEVNDMSWLHWPSARIQVWLSRSASASPLIPGDTAMSRIVITPFPGDVDTTNNVIVRCDTVRSSHDPNEISVSPTGKILSGTELEYAVHFENTGNDTAHNIYVLDTLAGYLDPSTLEIMYASAPMFVYHQRYGSRTIVKFEFPNIMLPDSSHHGLCDGMFIYKIKSRTGLAHNTVIPARVGIYFDDNEVVITNTASNTVIIPFVSIVATPGTSVCVNDSVVFTATSESIKASRYQWQVNGINAGVNSGSFTVATPVNGQTVKCLLYNPAGDTLIAASGIMTLAISPLPIVATISGASSVCEGASVTLSASATGGIWTVGNSNATIAGGVVTGAAAGTAVISYSLSNSCGAAVATHVMTVNPAPYTGAINGESTICVGEMTLLTSSGGSGIWSIDNSSVATVSNGVVNGLSGGEALVSFSVSNVCGNDVAVHPLSVVALPDAGTISGNSSLMVGDVVGFSATVDGGVWSSATNKIEFTGNHAKAVAVGVDTVTYTVTNYCGSSAARFLVSVGPAPLQLYMDPTRDVLFINTNGASYNAYSIINSLGQLVYQQQLTGMQTNIDVRMLPAGVYRIRFTGGSGPLVKTFVKM